jgi:hypothetical protein
MPMTKGAAVTTVASYAASSLPPKRPSEHSFSATLSAIQHSSYEKRSVRKSEKLSKNCYKTGGNFIRRLPDISIKMGLRGTVY